jgi:PhnB protein
MIAPYIGFAGRCREAMTFYAEVLGATDLNITTFAEGPPVPGIGEDMKDKVMHSEMSIDGGKLMGADGPASVIGEGSMVSVMHAPADAATGQRIFDRLAEGGELMMPYQRTFWSEGFGMLKDRFGISWMISAPGAQG